MQETRVWFLGQEVPTPVFLGSPGGSVSREFACSVGDLGSVPGLLKEGKGYPHQYSGLENFTDRGAWQATVRGVPKSQTRLSISHFHIYIYIFFIYVLFHYTLSQLSMLNIILPCRKVWYLKLKLNESSFLFNYAKCGRAILHKFKT